MRDVNLEVDIYEQRSKQLKKLIAQRKELIEDATDNIDSLIDELKENDTELTDLPTDF
jgi:predicted  nucleic acid-binding Zn-ribbon protein